MKRTDLICLLPVYNSEKYLKDAINSILNQTFSDFKLLVINDGSTDGSVEILNSFSDPRIEIVTNVVNSGLIFSLNKGMELCQAKYVIRMDADDVCEPGRFEQQYRFMESHPGIWACGSQVSYLGNLSGTSKLPLEHTLIATALLFGNSIIHPSVIIRVDEIRKIGLKFENEFRHAEDYRLWTKVVESGGGLHNLDQALLKYRVEGQNISLRHFNQSFDVIKKVWKDYFQFYGIQLSDEQLKMHGIFCRRLEYSSEFRIPLFRYLKDLKKMNAGSQWDTNEFTRQFNFLLNKLFYRICEKDRKSVWKYWWLRKRIRMSEIKFCLSSGNKQ